MKKIIRILPVFCLFAFPLTAQTNLQLGAGYFGHTATHPGAVVELELERSFSEKASLPLRLGLGFYIHPRQHTGYFLDVHGGFRRSFRSGLFLEESIGIGVLATRLNGEDGVFKVDEYGQVREASKFNQPDLMPSLTLGIGWDLAPEQDRRSLLWLRPKLFWQFPQKITAVYHVAVQVGFSHTILKRP